MIEYFLLYCAIAAWLFRDATRRHFDGLWWALGAAIFGPLVVPIYLSKRPLRDGEIREGGFAWNVLAYFLAFWTLTLINCWVATFINVWVAGYEFRRAQGALAWSLMLCSFLWFAVVLPGLVLAFFLRKSRVVERGPSGPMALDTFRA